MGEIIDVGRAGITILPDTSKFKRDLQAFLKRQQGKYKLGITTTIEGVEKVAKTAREQLERQLGGVDTSLDVDMDERELQQTLRKIKRYTDAARSSVDVDIDQPRKSEIDKAIHAVQWRVANFSAWLKVRAQEPNKSSIDEIVRDVKKQVSAYTAWMDTSLDSPSRAQMQSVITAVKAYFAKAQAEIDTTVDGPEKAKLSAIASRLHAWAAAQDVELDVDLDAPEAAEYKKLRAQIDAHIKAMDPSVDIDAEIKNLQAEARKLDAWAKAQDVDVTIDAHLDDLHKVSSRIKEWASRLDTRFDVKANLENLKTTSAKIKAWAESQDVKIQAIVDTRAFQRLAGATGSAIGGVVRLTTAMTALGSAVVVVGASTASLLPLLGSMVSGFTAWAGAATTAMGALSIPAIVGLGSAFGVLKSAVSGFGDALSAEDAEAYAEAIKGMSQETVAAVETIKNSFDGLGSSLRDSFWANVTNFTQLSGLFESMHAPLERLAASFGTVTSSIVGFLSSASGMSQIMTIMDGATGSAANFGGLISSIVPGIVALGAAATPVLEELTSGLSDATGWSERMQRSLADGTLTASIQDTVDQTIQGIQNVWGVLTTLTDIFRGVTRASTEATGSMGGNFTEALSGIATWVNSLSGQNSLQSFFSSTSSAVGTLAPLLSELAEILMTRIVPAASGFIQGLGPGLSAFFERLGPAIQPVLDQLPQFGAAVGDVLAKIDFSSVAAGISTLIGFISKLMPILEVFAPYLDDIAVAVGAVVVAISGLSKIAGIVRVVTAAFEGLKMVGTIISGVMTAIKPVLALVAANPITAAIAAVVAGFILLYKHSESFRNFVDGIVAKIKEFAVAAYEHVVGFFTGLPEKISSAWSAITEWFASLPETIWTFLSGIASRVIEWASALPGQILEGIQSMGSILWDGIILFFTDGIPLIIGTVLGLLQGLWDGIVLAAKIFWNGVVAMWNGAWAFGKDMLNRGKAFAVFLFTELPRIIGAKLAEAIASVVDFARNVPENIGRMKDTALSFIQNLAVSAVLKMRDMGAQMIGAAVGFAVSIPQHIANMKNRAIEFIFSMAGRAVDGMRNMRDGMMNMANVAVDNVVGFFSGLPGRIVGAVGNLWDSGRSILSSFVDGLKAGFEHAKSVVADQMQKVRNYFPFSPAKEGAFSGKGWVLYSGRSLGPAFARGIQDTAHTAVAAAEKLTDGVQSGLSGVSIEGITGGLESFDATARQIINTAEEIARAYEKAARDISGVDLANLDSRIDVTHSQRLMRGFDEERYNEVQGGGDFIFNVENINATDERDAADQLRRAFRREQIKAGRR